MKRGRHDEVMPEERTTALASIAWFYYIDGLTQADIAERMKTSRATVGRLLQEARETGVVRISIDPTILATMGLSRRLCDRYGLEDALVVPRRATDSVALTVNRRIAIAAAGYLERYLRPGAVIGFGWGDTVMNVLFSIRSESLEGVTFASVAGGIDRYTREVFATGNGIQAHLQLIPAPLVVNSPATAEALRQDTSVTRVLELSRTAVATITGVGGTQVTGSSVRSGLYSPSAISTIAELGGAGDMLGEWFDADGRVVPQATSDRRIGMDLAELATMPHVIGVAAGVEKATAIRAAVLGGYLDVLITDEPTAELLLA
ncbi:MAG: sugar-binding transcriptional regulator [Actinobacteria bacterium]|nr:sugar-binding transcriptional regulator [Actinomycetota bacterium]